MTKLQRAIAAFQRENTAEMERALTWCTSLAQRDQCRAAYAERNWKMIDAISQQHGMVPMNIRAMP